MPKSVTKFNDSWLHREDDNKNPVKIWLTIGSKPTTFRCSLCRTNDLDCGNQGWRAVQQHLNNFKHQQIFQEWQKNVKFIIPTQVTTSSTDTSNSTAINIIIQCVCLYMYKDLNLSHIRGKTIGDYARQVLRAIFSHEELLSSILPPGGQQFIRKPLDSGRFEFLHNTMRVKYRISADRYDEFSGKLVRSKLVDFLADERKRDRKSTSTQSSISLSGS
ncbi:unnamed protein product [Rotaria socialis]|nr:unnamed protein product [Rotaria socialis]CAF3384603.1 unnamed protein product [Rotaria socialis]CAF3531790.1 unnamed protein product [Rotaria socialis]CAF3762550.1 unnamed protein product [Rotaria socialis]CAF4122137.1 unnamed protein product [Rotaria socialis]